MASYILLEEKYFRSKSIYSNNVDYKQFKPLIEFVQDAKIDEVLGTNLLNLIVTQAQAGTLTTENATLLNDYILPAMQWLTACEAAMVLKFRFTNAGVMENSTDNSQPSQTSDVRVMENRLQNIADTYLSKLTNHIQANQGLYPTYYTNTGLSQTQPKRTNNAGGLFLDDDLPRYYRTNSDRYS